jgi:ring-1,2-phenylacetyl-CoA epoxidase subunit PaaD
MVTPAGPDGPPRVAGGDAWAVAAAVPDPEMPVLTLADLGVLRRVQVAPDGGVEVWITPTYTGCPALEAMRADLTAALHRAGFAPVQVRTVLSPAWSTDWISAQGRRKLAAAGISPPGPAPRRPAGPVPLSLVPAPHRAACPRCGSAQVRQRSRFGPTPCTALMSCTACGEPFQHVKEI